MKQNILLATTGLATLLASGLGAPKVQYGDDECYCNALCTATGDPHLTNFWGEKELLANEDSYLLYQLDNFVIEAKIFKTSYIQELRFGDQTVSVDSCDEVGKSFTMNKLLRDGNITAYVECKHANRKMHVDGFHLDVTIAKENFGKQADFRSIEKTDNAKGACITLPSQDNLQAQGNETFVNSSKTPKIRAKCQCKSTCFAYGDPHIIDFDQQKKTILSSGDLLLYSQNNVNVIGKVQDTRIRTLTVGKKSYTASKDICDKVSCHTCNNKYVETHDFPNGQHLEVEIRCRYLGKVGYFFDVLVRKEDTATLEDQSFDSLEESAKSTGACRNQAGTLKYNARTLLRGQ